MCELRVFLVFSESCLCVSFVFSLYFRELPMCELRVFLVFQRAAYV